MGKACAGNDDCATWLCTAGVCKQPVYTENAIDMTRAERVVKWSLLGADAVTEIVYRGDERDLGGDHWEDTYAIVFRDQNGTDISTGKHGLTFTCEFATDGSCSVGCNNVPARWFDGTLSYYGPQNSAWYELRCVFKAPVTLRSIEATSFSAGYSDGVRLVLSRGRDGKLRTLTPDGGVTCTGCQRVSRTITWGQRTKFLTVDAKP